MAITHDTLYIVNRFGKKPKNVAIPLNNITSVVCPLLNITD